MYKILCVICLSITANTFFLTTTINLKTILFFKPFLCILTGESYAKNMYRFWVDEFYRNNCFSILKMLTHLLKALFLTLNIFFWLGERLFTVSTWLKLVYHYCIFLWLGWGRSSFLPDFFFRVLRIMH